MEKRYYVNFSSLVDKSPVCRFFKTRKEAETFAKQFNISYIYSISCNDYIKNFIDNEIHKCNTQENYKFQSETHFLMEDKVYVN